MTIEVLTLRKEALKQNDYRDFFGIMVDGEMKLGISDGMEPEDASISRDLSFVTLVPGLMRYAFQAGERRESLDLIHREISLEQLEELY